MRLILINTNDDLRDVIKKINTDLNEISKVIDQLEQKAKRLEQAQ